MPSKRLMGFWSAMSVSLLAAGVITLVFSIVWRAPNLLRNIVINHEDLTAGLALGVALLITWAISIGAIVQPNHVTIGLVILNWALLFDALGIVTIGSILWFFTLEERNNFHTAYAALDDSTRIAVQDQLQCCGYFNSTDLVSIGGQFCQNTTFVQGPNNATGNFCVGPLTHFADTTLQHVFTTIYGWMAIIICLFLASLCVINKRVEEERFKKIDAKRGGRGFV